MIPPLDPTYPERLAEIRRRAEDEGLTARPWEALPGDWAVIGSGSDSVIHGYYDGECPCCGDEMNEPASVAACIEDIEFIAHARADVPDLLAEVERLRAGIEVLAAQAHSEWEANGDSSSLCGCDALLALLDPPTKGADHADT